MNPVHLDGGPDGLANRTFFLLYAYFHPARKLQVSMKTNLSTPAPSNGSPSGSAAPVPFSEHIRRQFESQHRRHELASDLTCYRPGNALHSIRYIAHPHGLHVARWLKVLSYTQAHVTIDTANPVPAFSNDFVTANPVLPAWLKLPMTIRYFLAGLALRYTKPACPDELIHAHCASGNGTLAWLSSRRYVLGTYGSEIYGARQRGRLYCWLLKQILQNAERISVGSFESTKILVEDFQVPPEKIYFFHLGYDDENFFALDHAQRMELRAIRNLPVDEPVWVINRRTDPHYRTQEVVNGFLSYSQMGGRGRLIVLCGDHQPEYTKSICDEIESHPHGDRVVVVDRMLSPKELGSWLQISDFSVSVPKTDNFSVSTLESLACGAIPILSNLEGYAMLRHCKPVQWMTKYSVADFAQIFAKTAATWPTSYQASRKVCLQFVADGYSTDGAVRDIAAFYLGDRSRQAVVTKKAA
ncbi:glycosyltransferase [Schlesneria sp. T3-172]|uniref:glycosyltransferase n=1 Tax=Schlesneria sphaerica TaxID=3373610 RepID=UPI0037C52B5A